MAATTKVAALVEAENEEGAAMKASSLAREGQLDTLDRYLDPAEFVEIDEFGGVDDVISAESVGYGDAIVVNR